MSNAIVRQAPEGMGPGVSRAGTALRLAAFGCIILLVPFAVRAANALRGAEPGAAPSYLPALEGPRARETFDPFPIEQLRRAQPGYVVIGDSMPGTRIDRNRLAELSGMPVAPILRAGSGSTWWYLVLKNYVIASGVKPRCVFIFFRDTNLTNVMFRPEPWMLDAVAHEREDELNAVIASALEGPWHRIDHAVARGYGADQAREWMERSFTEGLQSSVAPEPGPRAEFLKSMNDRFGLDHLRPFTAADVQAATDREADFNRYRNRSVLPLMLRDAKAAGITLCFVRVQRRPVGGKAPYQSPAMRRYVKALQNYVESNGAWFHDDTGDSALTLDMYEDGDHLARWATGLYTAIFFKRMRPIFQQ